MLRDYSSTIAQDVDEDTDDLEPVDPSVFFGLDDEDEPDVDDTDTDEEEDEDEPEDEEDENEY